MSDPHLLFVRETVVIAQCECICEEHWPVCLLTEEGARAALQPFVYG